MNICITRAKKRHHTYVYESVHQEWTIFRFYAPQKALEDLGMSPDEILQVFRLVASILKLGNLNFVPTTNMDGTEGCGVSNDYGNNETKRRN